MRFAWEGNIFANPFRKLKADGFKHFENSPDLILQLSIISQFRTLFPDMVRVEFTKMLFDMCLVFPNIRPYGLTIDDFGRICDAYAIVSWCKHCKEGANPNFKLYFKQRSKVLRVIILPLTLLLLTLFLDYSKVPWDWRVRIQTNPCRQNIRGIIFGKIRSV